MTEPKPSFVESISLRASILRDVPVKAAIDRGASLTKVIFLPRGVVPDRKGMLSLQCLTFRNELFEAAVLAMKQQAQLPASGRLHITGVGAVVHKTMIKEHLGLDVDFIDEFTSITHGTLMLVNHSDPDHLFFPVSDRPEPASEAASFPAIVMYVGSSNAMFHVDQAGRRTSGGGSYIGGKVLMSLAKPALGVEQYDDLIALAGEGSAVSDGRSEIACSLLDFVATELAMQIVREVERTGQRNIYVVGNTCRGTAIRQRVLEHFRSNIKDTTVNLRFLRGSCVTTVGTMLATPE